MKPVGWEMRPLGWLLVIVILATLCYLVIRKLRRVPPASKPEA